MTESVLKEYLLKHKIDFKEFESFMLHKTVSSIPSGESFYFASDIEFFLNQI